MFQRAAWHMQDQIFRRAVQPQGCPNGAQQCLFSTSQDRENPAIKPHKMLKLMLSGQSGTTNPNGKVLTPISPFRAKPTVSGKPLSLKNANYRNSLLISRKRVWSKTLLFNTSPALQRCIPIWGTALRLWSEFTSRIQAGLQVNEGAPSVSSRWCTRQLDVPQTWACSDSSFAANMRAQVSVFGINDSFQNKHGEFFELI